MYIYTETAPVGGGEWGHHLSETKKEKKEKEKKTSRSLYGAMREISYL